MYLVLRLVTIMAFGVMLGRAGIEAPHDPNFWYLLGLTIAYGAVCYLDGKRR